MSAEDGRVTRAGRQWTAGNMVIIESAHELANIPEWRCATRGEGGDKLADIALVTRLWWHTLRVTSLANR